MLVGLQPILTVVLARIWLGERVVPRQWLGLALGLAGVWLVVRHKVALTGDGKALAAILLALVGISVGTLYQKRFCSHVDLRSGAFIQLSQQSSGPFKVGDVARFTVASTREASTFYYEVLGRGKVVFSDYTRESEIAVTLTPLMAPEARLLVLATARSEELDAAHPLPALLRQLRSASQVAEIALEPLDAAETAELAAQVGNRVFDADAATRLYRETEGNPLFVVETVRAESGAGPVTGVPEDAILMEDEGRTTQASLESVAAMLAARGVDDAVFVSDPTHTLRVLRIAEDAGLTAWGSPTRSSPVDADVGRRIEATTHELGALALYFIARGGAADPAVGG